jgi:alpha-L-rhamnosidase
MTSDAQTAYALAIVFGLFPDDGLQQAAGQRLADLVRAAGNRIATDFAGSPVITYALTMSGGVDAGPAVDLHGKAMTAATA